MDNTSWPEALIASTAIVSGLSFVGLIVWQVSRIILTGMTLGHRREHGDSAKSHVD